MGKVHVTGTLWELLRGFKACSYAMVDVGPLLGGPAGGPWAPTRDLDVALSSITTMNVLLRDNGSTVEVCDADGQNVVATVNTTVSP